MEEIKEILLCLKEIQIALKSLSDPITHIHIEEKILSVDEAAEVLHASKSGVYHMVAEKAEKSDGIPYRKKSHKVIYFLKSELIAWVKALPKF